MKDIILVILIILFIICILGLIALKIFDHKNKITYENILKINDAIYRYQIRCIGKGISPIVDYSDREDYDQTLWRLWDWGYTRILPKDKFEIIKPYMK